MGPGYELGAKWVSREPEASEATGRTGQFFPKLGPRLPQGVRTSILWILLPCQHWGQGPAWTTLSTEQPLQQNQRGLSKDLSAALASVAQRLRVSACGMKGPGLDGQGHVPQVQA